MIWVSFQCNDPDNGNSLGKCSAVHIHGEPDIELEGPNYPDMSNVFREAPKPANASDRCDAGFQLGRKVFACRGYKAWYGNWCWDAVQMTGVDVLNLVWHLRELGYKCVASEVAFGEAYDSGREITKELMQEALA